MLSVKLKQASLLLAGGLFASHCGNPSAGESSEKMSTPEGKPNIVIFFTDDNAFWYWGFGGGPDLSPNIDQLAADGMEFTQFYASSSVCTPSRFNLHTGRYAGRCQHSTFVEDFPDDEMYAITWNTYMDPEKEVTLGEILQDAGYYTGFVGKWHLSPTSVRQNFSFNADDDPADPLVDKELKRLQDTLVNTVKRSGFDYAASITGYNNDWHPVEAVNVHNLEWYARGAVDFIESASQKDQPFFLIVNITTHHGPCHQEGLKADIGLTQAGYIPGLEGVMPERSSVFTRIEEKGYPVDFKTTGTVWTDDLVDAVLDKLESSGFEENTAVTFTTDHNRFDGKTTNYQGGVHIPMIMRYPGVLPAGKRFNERMIMTDLMPTFLEMCNVSLPVDHQIDGRSMWKAIIGDEYDVDRTLYFEFGYSRGILIENWKLITFRLPEEQLNMMKSGEVEAAFSNKGSVGYEPPYARYPHYFEPDQLYYLEHDPGEQKNLAGKEEYEAKLQEMKQALDDILSTFDHPYPVYDIDPFYYSIEYEKFVKSAVNSSNMEELYWYREECY